MKRRNVLGGMAGTGLALMAGPSFADTPELVVALLAPLSGPWAQQGHLMQLGAKMAVDDINAQGGIKSLGGAKMRLISADAGESTETAVSALKDAKAAGFRDVHAAAYRCHAAGGKSTPRQAGLPVLRADRGFRRSFVL